MPERSMLIDKQKLLETLKKNKENHILEYNQAVLDYKEEALKQLKEQMIAVEAGSTAVRIHLVSPVDNSKEYDKIISMFEWELSETVNLTQNEFNQYILDELPAVIIARMQNSTYSKFKQ